MKSSSLEIWEHMARNPTGGYKKGLFKEKEFLLKNFPKNSVVLDIGSGFGRVLEILAPISKKIIGIDNDKEAVEMCKEVIKEFDNARVLYGDAENFEFKGEEFDVVTCLGATPSNFGNTKDKIFLEIKRVLKHNGLFFCSVYNDNALEERLTYYEKYSPNKYEVDKKTGCVNVFNKFVSEQFSKEQIAKILENNDFEVLEIIKEGVLNIVKSRKIKNDRE